EESLHLLRRIRSAASAATLVLAFAVPSHAFDFRGSAGAAREATAWHGFGASEASPVAIQRPVPNTSLHEPPGLDALASDTLTFRPSLQYEYWDSVGAEPLSVAPVRIDYETETSWLKAPMGDELLDHPDPWMSTHHGRSQNLNVTLDYNRSDL